MVDVIKIPPAAPPSYEEIVGTAIFGKPGRLMVGLWVVQMDDRHSQRFNASEMFQWTRATDRRSVQGIGPVLERFANVGLVERTLPDRSDAKWYRRCDHPLWDVYVMIDVALNETPHGDRRLYYQPTDEQVQATIAGLVALRVELTGVT